MLKWLIKRLICRHTQWENVAVYVDEWRVIRDKIRCVECGKIKLIIPSLYD